MSGGYRPNWPNLAKNSTSAQPDSDAESAWRWRLAQDLTCAAASPIYKYRLVGEGECVIGRTSFCCIREHCRHGRHRRFGRRYRRVSRRYRRFNRDSRSGTHAARFHGSDRSSVTVNRYCEPWEFRPAAKYRYCEPLEFSSVFLQPCIPRPLTQTPL